MATVLCCSDSVRFVWNDVSGGYGYADEISFLILNANGDTILNCPMGNAEYYTNGQVIARALVECPACPAVAGMSMGNLTSSSLTLYWNTVGNAGSYEVVYGPQGFNPNTGGISTTVYEDSLEVYNLSSDTTYDFYVRADCGSDGYSAWSEALTATPGLYTLGITGSDTISTCGAVIADNGGITSSYSEDCDFTLVVFPTSSDSTIRIRGTVDVESSYDYLFIYEGVGTNGTSLGAYSGIATVDTVSSVGPITLRFLSDGMVQESGFQLAVTCEERASCPAAYGLEISDIHGASAVARWNYNPAAGTPSGYDITVTDTASQSTMTFTSDTTMVILSGLDQTTVYQVCVETTCENNDQSAAICTYFATGCLTGGEVLVGEPNSTQTSYELPGYTYYNYSFSQQIFTADELVGLDTIYGFAIFHASGSNLTRNIEVYADTTSLTSYASASNFIVPATASLRFSGNYTYQDGWNEFRFNQPLVLNGTNGVVLTYNDITGSYVSSMYFTTTNTTATRTICDYTDYTPFSMASNPNGSTFNQRNNVKFLAPCGSSSCVPPSVTFGSATSTSVTVNWAPGFDESSWDVDYRVVGDSTWTSVSSATSANTETITGLTANTSYQVRVTSLCGSETAMAYLNVRTSCGEITVFPFTEGFENFDASSAPGSTTEPCWTRGTNYTYNYYPFIDNYEAASGSHSMYFYGTSSYYSYLALPVMGVGLDSLIVKFSILGTDPITVGAMTDPSNISTFTAVATVTGTNYSIWDEVEVELSSYHGNGRYIAFKAGGSGYADVYIDDIEVLRNSSCPRPTNPRMTGATGTDISIAWTDTATAGSYTVLWGTQNDIAAAIDSAQAYDTTFTITGLNGSTNYFVWVRSDCAGESSNWVPVGACQTSCLAVAVTPAAPYAEGFESGMPACWSQQYVSGSHDWQFVATTSNPSSAHGGSNVASYTHVSSGSATMLISNPFDFTALATGARLSFWHTQADWSGDQDELYVYYKADDSDSNWTLLASFTNNISAWTLEQLLLPNSINATTYRVAFKGVDSYGYGVKIDDVAIDAAPSCYRPSDLTATTITANSATLSWNGNASSYVVSYKDANAVAWYTTTANGNSVTLTNLTTATLYEVYVQAVCSATDSSEASDTYRFTTLCNTVSIPYTEDFENYVLDLVEFDDWNWEWSFPNSYPSHALPACWQFPNLRVPLDYPTAGVTDADDYVISGNNSFAAFCGATPLYAVLPLFSASLDSLQIRFDIYDEYYGQIVLGVVSSASDMSTFIPLQTWNNNSYYSVNDSILHRFALDTALQAGVQYQIAMAFSHTYSDVLIIDNVVVSYAPTCIEPGNLAVSNVNATGATLSWAGTAQNYEVDYRVQGAAAWTTVTAAGNSYTLAGLNSATPYEFRVRAICNGNDYSPYSPTAAFTTLCYAVMVTSSTPYFEGFEGSYPTTCWTMVYGDNDPTVNTMMHTSDQVYTDGDSVSTQSFRFSSYSSTSPYDQWLISPEFNCGGDMVLSFFYSAYSYGYEDFAVGYSTTDNSISSFTWGPEINCSSFTWTEYLDTLPSSVKFIAIHYYSDYAYYLFIDNFSLTTNAGGCSAPNVSITAQNYNSASFSWTGSAASYEVALRQANGSWPNATTVTSRSYTATNLQSATDYQFRVRQNCGADGYSAWAVVNFTTDSLPCLAPSNLEVTVQSNSSASFNWAPQGTETAWALEVFNTTFDSVYTLSAHPATIGGLTAGVTYYAAVSALCGNGAAQSEYSDTISFTTAVCNPVTGVTANVNGTTATIDWTPGANSPDQWDIEYGLAGFSQGEGTTVRVNSHPATISNLYDETAYDVYVRAVCGAGYVSTWSSKVTFTTGLSGISHVEGGINVSIFPNPANGSATISLSGVNGTVNIAIVDMNGRTLRTDAMQCAGDCVKSLTLDNLAQGAYFVRIYSDDVNTVKKLIVR